MRALYAKIIKSAQPFLIGLLIFIVLPWSSEALAAVTWRTSTRGDVGSTNPFSVTEPSGSAQNDILILTVYSYSPNIYANVNTPTGWTLVNTQRWFSGSDYNEVRTFWIRRGASAPSLSIARDFTVYSEWSIDGAIGVRTTGNPYSAQTQTTVGSRANPDPGSVATAAGEEIWALGYSESSSGSGWTAPSGYTLRNAGAVSYNMASASKTATGSSENPGAFSGAGGTNNCAEATWSLVPDGPAGITADASITLGGLGLSATGNPEITAAASTTLGSIGLTATGSLAINASASISLGSLGLAASGNPEITATMAATLSSLGLTADATVSSGAPVTADASITIGAVGITAEGAAGWTVGIDWTDSVGEDGYRIKRGTASNTYDWSVDIAADTTAYDLTGLDVGVTYYVRIYPLIVGVEQTPSNEISFTVGAVVADTSITISNLTLSATGNPEITATLAATLGSLGLSADGSLEINANVSTTIGSIGLSADAIVGSGSPVVADASITLSELGLTADATVSSGAPVVADADIAMGNLTLTATGNPEITAITSTTLGNFTLVSDATVTLAGINANADIILGNVALSSGGSVSATVTADASITLSPVLLTARAVTTANETDTQPPFQPLFRTIFQLIFRRFP